MNYLSEFGDGEEAMSRKSGDDNEGSRIRKKKVRKGDIEERQW